MVVTVLILLAAVAAFFASRSGDDPTTPSGDGSVAIASASTFDPPPGDGREHPDEVPLAIDGDDTTAWTSETYKDPKAMAGKDGVGLVLSLEEAASLGQVDLQTAEGGWSAQVYAVDGDVPADLAGWGAPLASVQGADAGLTRLTLDPVTADQVMVWFTQVPASGAVQVSEATVRSR